ncbi:hypothetical protein TSUD_283110 [Trifolium subterraneum]|uniref:Replication factor A C-terminal domain-containing protein n=1 Tax=Trifolium subterraneum TaxID=3900 RepID=A0A2Z6NHM5_TRISU|nr:hypothetical protein TSUD_283110 [Trifolium subterraneum]
MKFVIDKFGIPPHFVDDLPEFIDLLSFAHDGSNFRLAHEKALTYYDVCTDVIGHVVEKNTLKETEKNGHIHKVMDVTLEDLEGIRIHCTLWADFAVKMQQFIDGHDSSLPVIMVLQLGKLKKYLGSMGISNSFYGTKLFLNADIPEVTTYIERMNAANVELTQVVSQMSGPVIVTVADDLLQTPRMTIEDLIESSQANIPGTTSFFVYNYLACTRCASRITFIAGQLYCEKCKMPRTAIPSFKVHLQVIDDIGSITFVMFDRVVSQVLGRTAQDLLDTMNNVVVNNEEPSYGDFVCNLGDDTPLVSLEGGDSSNNEEIIVHGAFNTPTSKLASKKSADLEIIGASATKETLKPSRELVLPKSPDNKPAGKRSANPDGCDDAAVKETKLVCVKIESSN